jgi:hypothetical protein
MWVANQEAQYSEAESNQIIDLFVERLFSTAPSVSGAFESTADRPI